MLNKKRKKTVVNQIDQKQIKWNKWATIIQTVVGIIAILFSIVSFYYTFNPLPNKPVLQITTTSVGEALPLEKWIIQDVREPMRLVIYNAGNAPCLEAKIKFDDRLQMSIITNYDYAGIHLRPYDWSNISKNNYPMKRIELANWNNLGFIPPNGVIALEFHNSRSQKGTGQLEFVVSCANTQKVSKIITYNMLVDNFVPG